MTVRIWRRDTPEQLAIDVARDRVWNKMLVFLFFFLFCKIFFTFLYCDDREIGWCD